MQQKLIKLGFSEKEAKVYIALLELGTASVTAIARRARLNRTTLYDVMPDLVRRGLVTQVVEAKKETFSAESPEKISLLLENRLVRLQSQVDLAKDMVDELKYHAAKSNHKPRVRIFEGKNGLRALYEDSLLAQEDIRSFSSTESLEKFDHHYLNQYFKRRAERGIFIKAIINDVPSAHDYQKRDAELRRELRIVPHDKMDIHPEVYVYDNKVAFFSLQEELGVLVESADIATALKKLYDLAWAEAGNYKTT